MSKTYDQPNDFIDAVRKARAAAEGDSNDAEIEALWHAIDEACIALGVTDADLEGEG